MALSERPTPLPRTTLRISLLQQCQYDCGYCRPGSVTPTTTRAGWLTANDYQRLAALFAEVGVTLVRLTGGEPLLREDLPAVLRALRDGLPDANLALTTNGLRLAERLGPLAEAGLQRATVHVDSLRPERYQALMGNGDVALVLKTVLAARAVLEEVKLNVVVQRGKNDDEIPDFLDWSKKHRVEVRFVELMNTGSAVAYTREVFFSGKEIVARAGPVTRLPRRDSADPAALYQTGDGVEFGVIASDTEPFCRACNRLRLTADGRLRGCLYEAGGAPLGEALRKGASDDQLRAMIRLAQTTKRSHHPGQPSSHRAPFSMADTGG